MKKTFYLLSLVLLSISMRAQKTYIPDDNFEQILINLNLDDIFDDSVETSAIDTVTVLYMANYNISSLTGIENFLALRELICSDNQLVNIDLSYNSNLETLNCRNNLLTSLDVRNGNNSSLLFFTSTNNPNLFCIAVDDIAYANANWDKDNFCVFSSNCSLSYDENLSNKRKLLKIVDYFGRDTQPVNGIPLFYIYDDGTVNKKIVIK